MKDQISGMTPRSVFHRKLLFEATRFLNMKRTGFLSWLAAKVSFKLAFLALMQYSEQLFF
jgi:hypothetical protein